MRLLCGRTRLIFASRKAWGVVLALSGIACSRLAGVDYSDGFSRPVASLDGAPETSVDLGISPAPQLPIIVAGYYHTALLTREGTLKWWGASDERDGPDEAPLLRSAAAIEPFRSVPKLRGLAADQWGLTCANDATGSVWRLGRVVDTTFTENLAASASPIQVAGLSAVTELSGGDGMCARKGRTVDCWLPLGQSRRRRKVDIDGFEGASRIAIGLSGYACAIVFEGKVRCWGETNYRGALGNGTRGGAFATSDVSLPAPAIAIGAGADLTCALLRGGQVYCWGARNIDDETQDLLSPSPLPGDDRAIAIAVGPLAACLVTEEGIVKCWRHNRGGIFGVNPTAVPYTELPLVVGGAPTDALLVAVGFEHACALTRSGRVSCWGRNHPNLPVLGRPNAGAAPDYIEGPGYVSGL